jgi:hypothetical protein
MPLKEPGHSEQQSFVGMSASKGLTYLGMEVEDVGNLDTELRVGCLWEHWVQSPRKRMEREEKTGLGMETWEHLLEKNQSQ